MRFLIIVASFLSLTSSALADPMYDNKRVVKTQCKNIDCSGAYRIFMRIENPNLDYDIAGKIIMVTEVYARKYFPESHEHATKVALAMMAVETGFRNVSGDGGKAHSYMQVWKDTAQEVADNYGIEDYDLNKLDDNIHIGIAYLRMLYDELGDWRYAIMAYNTGPDYAEKYNQNNKNWHVYNKYYNRVNAKRLDVERSIYVYKHRIDR